MSDQDPTTLRLNRAMAALQKAKLKLERFERAHREPLAIVGMSCRFPAGGRSPEAFWQALDGGADGVVRIPKDRWGEDAVPDAPGTRYSALLDEVDTFDAAFFGISPREAERLDPQHRLLLEISWEALENAAIAPPDLIGSKTGVFVGIATSDYRERALAGFENIDLYSVIGNIGSAASGRISYTLGLQGPSISIDTACSSSLVAVHLAARSLRSGESDLALAGGVSLILSPLAGYAQSQLQALAPDGRCKTFDASANGFGRGEGGGMIVMKRLSDALRDRDRILALVRGSAVNQDGRSAGITAPNVLAQKAVLATALADAGVAAGAVSYVEAHGTGTPLGDPIEVEALHGVYGNPRPDGSRCVLGAVKTNIGHLESAAGIAGVIKTVLALEHGRIPKNLHFRTQNPLLPIEESALRLARDGAPWPSGAAPRIAGISSFGISGTNAHVIVEESPARAEVPAASSQAGSPELLVLSARSDAALRALAGRYAAHLEEHPEIPLADTCATAGIGRMAMPHRLALVASTHSEAVAVLRGVADGDDPAGALRGPAEGVTRHAKVAFLFTGSGAQYVGMGRALYRTVPGFRAAMDRCAAAMDARLGCSLLAVLFESDDASRLAQTRYMQSALFAIEVALCEQWIAWGVRPAAVMGHSLGEYAAAVAAGVLSMEDGARLVTERSRWIAELPTKGTMWAVHTSADVVQGAMLGIDSRVSIAALNGPRDVTISGDHEAVRELVSRLAREGVEAKELHVADAFHSAILDPMLDAFTREVEEVPRHAPRIPLVSNLTGHVAHDEVLEPSYWSRHAREPVRFADGMNTLVELGCTVFVEIGPHATLLGMGARCVADGFGTWIPSMRSGRDDTTALLEAAGRVFAAGARVNVGAVTEASTRNKVALPTYPFERQRYWMARPRSSMTPNFGGAAQPLRGTRLALAGRGAHFVSTLSPLRPTYLADHIVRGSVVVPGAFYLGAALSAAEAVLDQGPCELTNVVFQHHLELNDETSLQLTLSPADGDGDGYSFELLTVAPTSGTEPKVHAAGELRSLAESPSAEVSIDRLRELCGEPVDVARMYEHLGERGVALGPSFRWIRELRHSGTMTLATLERPDSLKNDHETTAHPILLDSCLQVLVSPLVGRTEDGTYLPFGVESVKVFGIPDGPLTCHGELETTEGPMISGRVRLFDEAGRCVLEMTGATFRRAPRQLQGKANSWADGLLELTWRQKELPALVVAREQPGRWLVFRDVAGICAPLIERLRAMGPCTVVTLGEAFHRTGEGFAIDPRSRADFERLLEEAFPDGETIAGVVYGWALDAAAVATNASAEDAFAVAETKVWGGALHLLQALAARPEAPTGRTIFVTCAALSVAKDDAYLAAWQAPLWGLVRSAQAEQPALRCTLVDLEFATTDASVLVAESLAEGADDQIAYRGGLRQVARLTRSTSLGARLNEGVGPELSADGAYLVSGGLGDLGLVTGDWLVERGARHVVLLGRRGLTTDIQRAAVAALEARGARVTVASIDVTHGTALDALVSKLDSESSPLRGIVHAAGVLDDSALDGQTMARFAGVMAPKVLGAIHLHRLAQRHSVDLFVLYSSAVSWFGSPGQANYAAANAFLDGLAHQRQKAGQHALSVHWGMWEAGLVARMSEAQRSRQRDRGARAIPPEEGMAALAAMIVAGVSEAGHIPLDMDALIHHPNPPLLVSELLPVHVSRAPWESLALREALGRAAASARPAILLSALAKHAARVMRLDPSQVSPSAPLRDLGLDSLMSVELRNLISASLGVRLPATFVFDAPTLEAMTAHLLQRVLTFDEVELPAASSAKGPRAAIRRDTEEPVAIVGIGCRFPGGVRGPDSYWELLKNGIDAIGEVPKDRWDIDAFYDPRPMVPGKMSTRWGGFVDGIACFDADFFGISPREAALMDPQQRMVLEVAWEALENASIAPRSLNRSRSGVFMGVMAVDYTERVLNAGDFDVHAGTGNMTSAIAGRLSYVLGLEGPSSTIDTACSSSLVTLHLAARSLRDGDCDLALAGGVNATLSPHGTVLMSRMGAMAADGRCKAFDASADGFVRGEGCGVVVLKRWSDAQRDGDRVIALVRGTAVGHDGKSNGFTAPRGAAQENVIRAALDDANIRPQEVGYVEAHGTGTSLGDPIELLALGGVFGEGRAETAPLLVGSVKTNLGHLESAAGIASVIKVALALRHGEIPPSLHFRSPNPNVAWETLPVRVVTERTVWPGRRVAGVSSFGMSGTNAHVVLEAPPQDDALAIAATEPLLVVLSAMSDEARREHARQTAAYLRANPSLAIGDIARTSTVGRSHFDHRLAVVATNRELLVESLETFAHGDASACLVGPVAKTRPKVAFLFSGQGSQYASMGRVLFDSEPVFRAALERCFEAIGSVNGVPIADVLFALDDLIDQTTYTQPALFAFQVALAELWRSWGIVPDAVVGHSIGEYAAAVSAGVLSLEDAARLVRERGLRMGALPTGGAMLSIQADAQRVHAFLAPHGPALEVAAYNAPDVVVVSGEVASVRVLAAALATEGIETRLLGVSHAFHSTQMDPMLDGFEGVVQSARLSAPVIPFVSSLTGEVAEASELTPSTYWRRQLREPVRFFDAVNTLRGLGITALVEIGPRPTLLGLAARGVPEGTFTLVPSVRQGHSERQTMREAAGRLFVAGAELDFAAMNVAGPRAALPTYPFEQKRHWIDAAPSADMGLALAGTVDDGVDLALRGRRLALAGREMHYLNRVGTIRQPYLADHEVFGHVIVPGAFFLSAALAAARDVLGTSACTLENVAFTRPLTLEGETAVHITFTPGEGNALRFALATPSELGFVVHAEGAACPSEDAVAETTPLAAIRERCPTTASVDALTAAFEAAGVHFGPAFRWITGALQGDGEALVTLSRPEGIEHGDVPHPTLIDACLQAIGFAFTGADCLFLPAGIGRLRVLRSPGGALQCHAKVLARSPDELRGAVTVYDQEGELVLSFDDVQLRRVTRDAFAREAPWTAWTHETLWRSLPQSSPEPPTGRWLVLSGSDPLGDALCNRLRLRGASCINARPGATFERLGPEEFVVDPTSATDLAALVDAARGAHEALTGMVYLWALDAPSTSDDIGAVEGLAWGGALHVLQALVARGDAISPRLWLVTRGAQAVAEGDVTSPWQAALWGLGRTAAAEHAELRTLLVDLLAPGAGDLDALEAELGTIDLEPQVAIRDGKRRVARLARARVAPAPALSESAQIHADGTYIVTGGLGALGLTAARWLVGGGANHVVLVGRSGLTQDRQRETIAELEARGATIVVAALDASNRDALSALLAGLRQQGRVVRGALHVAGVLDDGVLSKQTLARFRTVFAPKVEGALALEAVTQNDPLDFLVFYSSAAACFGTPGQANYAAANAVLGAIAARGRAQNRPTLAVYWGMWEGGMVERLTAVDRARMVARGVRPITAEQGMAALGALLTTSRAEVLVVAADPSALAGASPTPLLSELVPAAHLPSRHTPLRERLSDSEPSRRSAVLAEFLRSIVARVLGTDASTLPLDRPLRELGMDSLMAVELRTAVADAVGSPLPATLVFDAPTVSALATYLLARVLRFDDAPARALPAANTTVAAAVDSQEPIAVIGIGCRFPGGVTGPDAYWQLLVHGIDAITEVPASRWDANAYYDPRPGTAGKSLTRWGGFLEDVDKFDAEMFGISPREAALMDPQQRLVLEVGWEALEHAGTLPQQLAGTRTGIFLGAMSCDYAELMKQSGLVDVDVHSGTGTMNSLIAGRLAYVLGTQGPCVTVDTVCSSALVAVHMACQSLREGDATVALAGGVNLMFDPNTTVFMSQIGAMAPDGRCKPFDDSANGYVRGEGCGIVVLKRLSDAQRDGDHVLAIVRGSAIGHDGRSNGLTAPNGVAQEEVIVHALAQAGVAPAAVTYIEAHGTGTPLGDPIELNAIGAALATGRKASDPVLVGSVKSNIGHTESAAGIASLIKTVLMLQHGVVPQSLHFATPNSHVGWDALSVRVVTETSPWPDNGRRRIAGVSSFGMSGTNAHVVLEEAPSRSVVPKPATSRPAHLFVLSARSESALVGQALRHAAALRSDVAVADVCHSSLVARTPFARRLALVATSPEALRDELVSFAAGSPSEGCLLGHAAGTSPKVAFLFTGGGAQYAGMGAELYRTEPVFREALDRCTRLFDALLEVPLLPVILGTAEDSALLDSLKFMQSALFALEWALAELWRSWGVVPDAVMGHSLGEYTAACVAGVMDLGDAVRLVVERARRMEAVPGDGAMVSVRADVAHVEEALRGYEARVSVGAYNGPESVTLSGERRDVLAVTSRLAEQGFETRVLAIAHASHSPSMEPMLADFEAEVACTPLRAPRITLVSNVTGEVVGDEVLSKAYWSAHVRKPVRFAQGIQALVAAGVQVFVEIGPHTTLLGMGALCAPVGHGTWVPSMRRGRDENATVLEAVGRLFVSGVAIDGAAINRSFATEIVALPTYPFARDRHWLPSRKTTPKRIAATREGHPLLGASFRPSTSDDTWFWRSELLVDDVPYLRDHKVHGTIVLPAAAHIELALAAGKEVFGATPFELAELELRDALVLREGESRVVELSVVTGATTRFRIASSGSNANAGNRWTIHAEGIMSPPPAEAAEVVTETLQEIRERCPTEHTGSAQYALVEGWGLQYGPAFRGLEHVHAGNGEALGVLGATPEVLANAARYVVHPALLDASLHALFATVPAPTEEEPGSAAVPVRIGRVRVLGERATRALSHARIDGSSADVRLYDESGRPFVELLGIEVKRLDPAPAAAFEGLLEPVWVPTERPAAVEATPGTWLLVGTGAQSTLMQAELEARGFAVRCVPACNDDGTTYSQTQFAHALREHFDDARPCAGVVHLGAVDAADDDAMHATPAAVQQARSRGLHSVLALVKALVQVGLRDWPRLWLVTRGTQRVPEYPGAMAIAHAPLWGFGRTLRFEHPALRCTLIDLPHDQDHDAVTALVDEVLGGDSEDEIAFRSTQRFAGRVLPRRLHELAAPGVAEEETSVSFHSDATYLITGGLGGLGLELAKWMVEQGARSLVLVGRSGARTDAQQEAVASLVASGARVDVATADVASESDMRRVMAGIDAALPPLRGVVHAAGVLDDVLISDLEPVRFDGVFAPKVTGALILHELTRNRALDFFVLYASAASLVGAPGQANYAAANALLDALAHHRRDLRLPALSIDWGAFADVGLAAADDRRGKRLAGRGLRSLSPAEGNRLFGLLAATNAIQLGVLPIVLDQWSVLFPQLANSRRFSPMNRAPAAGQSFVETRTALTLTLSGMSARRGLDHVQEIVRDVVARVLRLPRERVSDDAPLKELGFDSLLALELRNRLEASVGIPLTPTLLWTYPTVSSLGAFLVGKLAPEEAVSVEPAPTFTDVPATAELPELATLDDEAKTALLEQELARLDHLERILE